MLLRQERKHHRPEFEETFPDGSPRLSRKITFDIKVYSLLKGFAHQNNITFSEAVNSMILGRVWTTDERAGNL